MPASRKDTFCASNPKQFSDILNTAATIINSICNFIFSVNTSSTIILKYFWIMTTTQISIYEKINTK